MSFSMQKSVVYFKICFKKIFSPLPHMGRYIKDSMELIIGGFAQGKLEYVLKRAEGKYRCDRDVSFGELCTREETECKPILKDLHLYLRRLMEEEQNVDMVMTELLKKNPGIIIISNEIGCGIVPLDAFERGYREKTGRICCDLAKKAEHVTRIICGIGTVIK